MIIVVRTKKLVSQDNMSAMTARSCVSMAIAAPETQAGKGTEHPL